MDEYQIFISYRREGGHAIAGRLADRLTSLGYHVFLDVQSMHSGKFDAQIRDAIESCRDLLLILSPGSLANCTRRDDWMRQEISLALQLRKNIIPILVDQFQFPLGLPQDIQAVSKYEGVVYSTHYFDSVVERIQELLLSGSGMLSKYVLETREYYKIRTPLINIYKKHLSTPKSYVNVCIFFEKQMGIDPASLHWRVYNNSNTHLRSLRDYFLYRQKDRVVEWYDSNKDRIIRLRRLAMSMKEHHDYYFYIQALSFAMGSMISLPTQYITTYPDAIVETFCCCMDLSRDHFGDFEEAFNMDGHGYREFREYLPLAFDVWATYHKGQRLTSGDVWKFNSYSALLFDFMVELSMLILDSCKDEKLNLIRTSQIRCYYKWLRKNNIYLPREIQEKIYRYL